MSRTNIFELIASKNDIKRDTTRICELFSDYYCFMANKRNGNEYTLEQFVDEFCFSIWKSRRKCIDLDDFLETVEFTSLKNAAKAGNVDSFLTVVEIVYNCWYQATEYIEKRNGAFICYQVIDQLRELMDDCLSSLNQKAYYNPDTEQCIIAEDSMQVTAAAEASEPKIAWQIIRYNYRELAGDIEQKKEILRVMGDDLEGRKTEITSIDNALYKNITGALNNLNIRHNNINPDNKSTYKHAVAVMPAEELEQHYDDLYQLILLAILEMDNVDRQRDMRILIQQINV